jgi:hypothetical protein
MRESSNWLLLSELKICNTTNDNFVSGVFELDIIPSIVE